MNDRCEPTRAALSAYIDGEIPPVEAEAIADHLTSCPSCSAEYHSMLETIGTLRSELTRFTAPDVLRARIRAAVERTPTEIVDAGQRVVAADGHRRRSLWTRSAALAATLVVGAALGGSLTMLVSGRSGGDSAVAAQVLSSHVRSLMPDHLTDIRSSDQHNVKPWFNGRLDYSPSVPRFDDEGYPLIGGRLDYIGDRRVAVVVYGRRQHLINVFSWPTAAGAEPLATTATNGYTMLHWRRGGIERWVVSDVNATELRAFAAMLQRADSGSVAPPTP
jgi:anti-sigma factor RsiW